MWWLGNERANWESVMGHNPLGWFRESGSAVCACLVADQRSFAVPIGGPVSDGLTYPVNPRFDAQGRQRPRSEWPAELQ
jgi:palmitoyltransferase